MDLIDPTQPTPTTQPPGTTAPGATPEPGEAPLPAAVSLHPECPDLDRLAPTRAEAVLRARAARVELERAERRDLWRQGSTRRRFLTGVAGAAGVVLADQLVTTRVSYAAAPGQGTLLVIFLRGGVDGLSVVVPADDPHLLAARPRTAVRAGALLPLDRGFGLHPALAPVHRLWGRRQLTAVPAVSTPDLSRSHFQAQDCLERGGATTGTTEGWLDRVLDKLGPGTTFRAVSRGSTLPRSLAGDQRALTMTRVDGFKLNVGDQVRQRTRDALAALYTGIDHPLAEDAAATLSALDTVHTMTATEYRPAARYPDNEMAKGLRELAQLIKGDVGVRVAAMDIGGWDHHNWMGNADNGAMKNMLTELGVALGAFATDLGDRFADVTVVTMTEFGRRIEENASAGTDHGHGAAVLLLGGGLAGGTVHGNWPGLAPEARDQGDVAGANDYRNVLGEVLGARLGLTPADLAEVFPGHRVQPVGVTG